jgi:regulator of protease activity HflC (stomatin/prohibitin superfamily)
MMPFVDRLKPLIDLREQVVSFPPQPVITEDNLVVQIDTVLYFTINDARATTYEVANPLQAIEQITVTTLRNVIGSPTLEQAVTSRDHINAQLRGVLDEATGKWGIRINRVELKSIEPPASIHEIPVPADAPSVGQGRCQRGVRHPIRVLAGGERDRRGVRQGPGGGRREPCRARGQRGVRVADV